MHRMIRLSVVISIFFIFTQAWAGPISTQQFLKKPKLVLLLVVDQFRADYLTRFEKRFLPARRGELIGGYRYLMEQGAYFPFAQYDVLQCMTGPGHAMILSGTYPYQTGIALNTWFDRTTQKPRYCVEDSSQEIVGLDPSLKQSLGMSPKSFKVETLGDVLKNSGYSSQVVSIALKDRAAILMGGHRADLALWLDPETFSWVSSRFYLPQGRLPRWVVALDQELSRRKGSTYTWKSSAQHSGLTLGQPFTHQTLVGTKESLSLPLGIEITIQAAKRAIDEFKLGRGRSTDLLAVSFSSHDYLGHLYGPNTLELEEMTVAEDREIAQLLNYVRRRMPGGLKDVLIVLTADHGIPPSSSWLKSQRIDAGKIDADELIQRLEQRLTKEFGSPQGGKWIAYQSDLNFYFASHAVKDVKISELERVAKAELSETPGQAFVFSRGDYERRTLPPGIFNRTILKSYIPERSGDLMMIPKPFYMVEGDPVSHMTHYSYDRTVPLIFTGLRVKPGVYSTAADVVDIAPTLSFILGIIAPAAAEGRILSEIF